MTMASTIPTKASVFQGCGNPSNAFGIWLIPRGPLVAQPSFLNTRRMISAMPMVAMAR